MAELSACSRELGRSWSCEREARGLGIQVTAGADSDVPGQSGKGARQERVDARQGGEMGRGSAEGLG